MDILTLAACKRLIDNESEILKGQLIVYRSAKVDLGALSAGAYGAEETSITIPEGYKTTGISCVAKNHMANTGGALVLQSNVPHNLTGTVNVYTTYYAPVNIANGFSDFYIYVLCVKA